MFRTAGSPLRTTTRPWRCYDLRTPNRMRRATGCACRLRTVLAMPRLQPVGNQRDTRPMAGQTTILRATSTDK
eukprot:11210577-Lingulodinium_polyedra.AAC.1